MFNFYKPVFSRNQHFSSVSGRISTRSSWFVLAATGALLQFPAAWMYNSALSLLILVVIGFLSFARRFNISINRNQVVFKRYLLGVPYFRCTADIHTVKIAPDHICFAPGTVEITLFGKKSTHPLQDIYIVRPSTNEVVEGTGLFLIKDGGYDTYTFGLKENGTAVYGYVEKTIRELAADARYVAESIMEEEAVMN